MRSLEGGGCRGGGTPRGWEGSWADLGLEAHMGLGEALRDSLGTAAPLLPLLCSRSVAWGKPVATRVTSRQSRIQNTRSW